jgi:GT2 family glycosyltransferase
MARVAIVIPTVGASRWLVPCLLALRQQAGVETEILLVDQGPRPSVLPDGLVDRILRPDRNLGFAAGTNLGLEASDAPFVATVNDDVLVTDGWLSALVGVLLDREDVAAVQGTVTQLQDPQRLDSRGLKLNDWQQAVQIGFGEPVPPAALDVSPKPVFGVSAAAALYRRSALEQVALLQGKIFDEALGSYYEDVDLACRLRRAGFQALWVPSARAAHAGSVTGNARPFRRQRLLRRNRYLALARWLGSGFWPRLPRMMLRDLLDGGQALLRGRFVTAAGIAAGGVQALVRLPRFVHRGPLPPEASP